MNTNTKHTITTLPVVRYPLQNLIYALEDFIEKKIAAEGEAVKTGYASEYLNTHLAISRNELCEALETLTSK